MTTAVAPAGGTAAPVVTDATIVARRRVGAYHLLSLAAPDVVQAAVPGQFVSVRLDAPGLLLRRPFAIAAVRPESGVVEVVVAVVGQGSAWLAAQPVSTTVGLTGPLGTGFAVPDAPTRCVLVGGGYGVAALMWLAGRLTDAGHEVTLCSGARTADALYPLPPAAAAAADRTSGALTLREATEDGTRGHTGLVTELADAHLGDLDADTPAAVFACGPMPMLAAVAAVAAHRGRPCQVAVEEHMACGVGVCMTCVVPTGDGPVRACIDGPVMDAGRIDWASVAGGGS